jgi:hypothetical protein
LAGPKASRPIACRAALSRSKATADSASFGPVAARLPVGDSKLCSPCPR